MGTTDCEFIPPPEAPIFRPTPEEFKDPLGYISKIRPIAEQTGICKIKPPPDWQPPFVVDVDNFRFTPRVQRLNELEATTRIKLNFLDKIAKFWELQGSSLKIPNVERKALDLYTLHKIVKEEGGMEVVTKERRWAKIASRMGYPHGRSIGSLLRQHYERILYPYDIFKSGASIREINISEETEDSDKKDKDYIPHGIPSRQAIKPPPEQYSRRSKRHAKESDIIDQIVCHTCGRGDAEESMLLCDGCDDSYHTFCLVPPLNEIPKGDWRCPKCVAEEVRKPQEAFGFEQAQREYTLQEFGEMADKFKSNYFNMAVHMVPPSVVEKEFWRIVNAVDEDVTVEYGADLHTMEHGSGFPTKNTKSLVYGDEDYVNSGWNLNNLPILEGSVLRHINADISGMKIPWTYVGMCFATFCWHNEDHWSYSINYLHWGEPKTWYGVPGDKAEAFEDSMRSAAPELFRSQPDLLHQLVTIMNPNILMSAGVPIYRTNQHAGEFVITFPRSYHAGFNQGYNFAEAVNFAPADWLPIGRVCISHYSMLHRFCVFSHDELVCKMAADPERLDISLAAATYQDMLKMVETEREYRKSLLEWGVTEAEREAFELLPDDERQCDYCKTTCFLSAVTCNCNSSKLVCITHKDRLCHCLPEEHCLRYRYTLDELPVMLHRLKVRAESFDNWAIKVKNALEATEGNKLEILELKELIQEAEEKKFPKSDLLVALETAIQDAEKCASVAQQLLSRKVRTRNRQSNENKCSSQLTLEDLQLFYEKICNLACEIKETVLIKDLLDRVLGFERDAKVLLSEDMTDLKKLEKQLDIGLSLDVDLPEIPKLKQKLQQTQWLEEVRISLSNPQQVTLDTLRKLLDMGVNIPPHQLVEKTMGDLQEMLTTGEKWEEKAKTCLQAKPYNNLSVLETIVNETSLLPVHLPNTLNVKDAVKKAKEWIAKVEQVMNGDHYTYLEIVEYLVHKGRPIPVHLEQLQHLEVQVEVATAWKERTARTFLKKNSYYTLMEVLSPKSDIGVHPTLKNKRKRGKDTSDKENEQIQNLDVKLEEIKNPAAIVAGFKQAEKLEKEAMHQLRIKNLRKRAEDVGDSRYCICHKGLTNNMLQCELCKDWFHANCVPLPKSASSKKQSATNTVSHLVHEVKFLCPMCMRSRRPRLETILALLVSLQKLPVRLPEGEALQNLTERAMTWQDNARQALATEELAAALAKLSVISQRKVEQAAREKTEKIISKELMKAASNPELKPHLQNVAQTAFSGLQQTNKEIDEKEIGNSLGNIPESEVPPVATEQEVPSSEPALIMDVETTVENGNDITNIANGHDDSEIPLNYNLEHAYSSASKSTTGITPRKHARKSPLIPRQLESPVLQLSDVAKAQLEELMMEGDLLEVSLDETQHIWRILQATRLNRDPLTSLDPFSEPEETDSSNQTHKKKFKKRKLEDCKGIEKMKFQTKSKISSIKENGKPRKKRMKINKLNDEKTGNCTAHTNNTRSNNSVNMGNNNAEHEIKNSVKKQLKIKNEPNDLKEKKENGATIKKDGPKINRTKQKLLEKPKIKKSSLTTRAKITSSKKGRRENNGDDAGDDFCSATRCLRPTGEAVNWVQCDGGCEEWFHLLCVGLNVTDISESEDYICPHCTHRQNGVKLESEDENSNAEKESQQFNTSLSTEEMCEPQKSNGVFEECEFIQQEQLIKQESCHLDSCLSRSSVHDCINVDVNCDNFTSCESVLMKVEPTSEINIS
ncbi:lysine-specific demethylase 5A isoform X3 [Centruroides vittatus]|uniref:lysine-specific demethylase 5A isoform X3 n=1 Tax=Centruroides vittatus TaxID=120091 RepID=UPI00350FA107